MLTEYLANNQRALALFLAGGYHDSLVRRLTGVYRERRRVLLQSLAEYLHRLDENPEEYLRYFDWRESYEIVPHVSGILLLLFFFCIWLP